MADQERYVLEEQIGAGGMGEVWLATDTLLNRPVAVKFLQTKDNRLHRDLFLAEARTLASLHHPNITTIYDAVFDEEENRFYLMMEYVEGKTLSKLIKEAEGPLPLDTVIDLTIELLHALKYAHGKGFVHRDIKPDNIVIQDEGVKLADFGLAILASLLAEDAGEYAVGSPPYMPPEQILAETLDERADFYALGVTLFEMVTGGRLPFEYKDNREVFTAHIEEIPPSVRTFTPQVPMMLAQVIDRLLAKDPQDRYATAEALLAIFNSLRAKLKFSQRHLELLTSEAHPLVDRQEALKELEATWSTVQETNTPRLVAVWGETGSGKSRLIAQFLTDTVVAGGQIAAVGRCDELGAPYTPFAEILATIFDQGLVKPITIESQIDRVLEQIPSLAPLLNIKEAPTQLERKTTGLWQTLTERMPHQAPTDPAQAQWQFFATVLTILSELGPTVIFFENAALLDESSVSLSRFLIQQAQFPLLFIAEATDPAKPVPWLEKFSADEKKDLTLTPLSRPLVKEYLGHLLGGTVSEAVVNVVKKRSRGIPLRIEEVTRQLSDLGNLYQSEAGQWRYKPAAETTDLSHGLVSPFLLEAFTRRLEKLTQKSRDVLALAALLEPGPEFEFDVWLALLGGEPERETAEAALTEGLERRLVRSAGESRYMFRPADVSKALEASFSDERRRDLHQEIAQILITKERQPILVGYHYERAGLATQSAHYLEAAGARAMAANAVEQAIECYCRAVELIETTPALEALGKLYRQQGNWRESTQALERALERAQPEQNVEQQARLLNSLAFTLWLSSRYRAASERASAVLKLPGVSSLQQATAQSHLGMVAWLLGHLVEAETWCRRAVDSLLGGEDQAKLAAAYNRLGLVYVAQAKFDQARQLIEAGLEIRRQSQDHWGQAYCLTNLGRAVAEQGDFVRAKEYFDSAQQLFEKIDSSDGLMVVYTEQSRSWLYESQPKKALPLLAQALELVQRLTQQQAHALGDIYLLVAWANLLQQDWGAAGTNIKSALALVEPAGNKLYIATAWSLLAQLEAAQNRPAQAEKWFKKGIDLFKELNYPAGLLRTQLKYVDFLMTQGKAKNGAALVQQIKNRAAQINLYLP